MDATHFDRLVASIGTTGSRRLLLRLLAVLPLVHFYQSVLAGEGLAANRRRNGLRRHGDARRNRLRDERRKRKKNKKKKNRRTQPGPPPPPPTCAQPCTGTTPICNAAGLCVGCTTHSQCGARQLCLDDGRCQACTVTCTGTPAECGADLQSALSSAATVYACPGHYAGNFNSASVTLIGAGEGTDLSANTILDAMGSGSVYRINGPTVDLHRLRITGGESEFGGGVFNFGGTMTLTSCTVTGNTATSTTVGGGGLYNLGPFGSLALTDCTVTGNNAQHGGGIAQNSGFPVTLIRSAVQGNTATGTGGGIAIFSGAVEADEDSTVTGNTAGTNGGGVFNDGTMTCGQTGSVSGNTVGGTPNNCINGTGTGCETC